MAKRAADKPETSKAKEGITRIIVSGYKSINKEQSIEIKPLTILAGANSSGKSSMMQPLLLLKQTLEATYDPGPLLIDGPNVKFTSADQMLSRIGSAEFVNKFHVGVEVEARATLTCYFDKQPKKGFEIKQMVYVSDNRETILRPGMTHEEITSVLPPHFREVYRIFSEELGELPVWKVIRDRCFLALGLLTKDDEIYELWRNPLNEDIESSLRKMIHLPGLRGNPARAYPKTAAGPLFSGTFQEYTASVISNWEAEKNLKNLQTLSKQLEMLGLTWKVTSRAVNDTQVELQVGRLPHAAKGGTKDLVNIADVGFGVSQTLPVLVALLVAEPGQLVYIEEPEIHLHPRAQSAMAQVLADAAKRGVQVVIETHSQLLLLGIQTLVAEGKLSPDLVKLHWFKRRNDGSTEITSADLDGAGAFGDWPEDFAEVALKAESRYLDAAESQQVIH